MFDPYFTAVSIIIMAVGTILLVMRIVFWLADLSSPVHLLYTPKGWKRLFSSGRSLTAQVYSVQQALCKLRGLPAGADLTEVLNDINRQIEELNLAIYRDHGVVAMDYDKGESLPAQRQE